MKTHQVKFSLVAVLLCVIFSFSNLTTMQTSQAAGVHTKEQPEEELHIQKIDLKKKKKKVFDEKYRDSSLVVYLDTLIMKDRSALQFYGLKNIKLIVKYAEIGDGAYISGMSGQNNASNFEIEMHIVKLGSLYVLARGEDAMNGTRTFPNGNGGKVDFAYSSHGIQPQSKSKKSKNYLFIDVSGGGRTTNPQSDLGRIYSQIRLSGGGLRGVPQGQIYSGSPGQEGKVNIYEKSN